MHRKVNWPFAKWNRKYTYLICDSHNVGQMHILIKLEKTNKRHTPIYKAPILANVQRYTNYVCLCPHQSPLPAGSFLAVWVDKYMVNTPASHSFGPDSIPNVGTHTMWSHKRLDLCQQDTSRFMLRCLFKLPTCVYQIFAGLKLPKDTSSPLPLK